MKITFIGSGYVGLVSAACFADVGNEVICVDRDELKIDRLRKGDVPIYEPGLREITSRGMNEERLHFTTDLATGLESSEICFITVDTPPNADGSADLSNVMVVAESIGRSLDHSLIVVTKSTVPVGTTLKIKEIIMDELKNRKVNPSIIKVAANPEFLKEGDAVNDFRKPHRVVVGIEDGQDDVADILHEIYAPFMRKQDRFLKMDVASAELTKYAANAMLACRISFMNSLARICEKVGANINHVRNGVGRDPRIGSDFLYPGLGYGGSCFPKDVDALVCLGKEYAVDLTLIESIKKVNESQVEWFYKKIEAHFNDRINNKIIAFWGLAFKSGTDDLRRSMSLKLIEMLLEHSVDIRSFDPIAGDKVRALYGNRFKVCDSPYECLSGAEALIIGTDESEFRSPDWSNVLNLMAKPVIFDGRNLYDKRNLESRGFIYFCVGGN